MDNITPIIIRKVINKMLLMNSSKVIRIFLGSSKRTEAGEKMLLPPSSLTPSEVIDILALPIRL